INELVQVVLNIVNNAIDSFVGLQRKNKFVHLYVKEQNNTLQIYITDNGCGILEENIAKLFEPYFSTKGKNGTGLGLYMSQKIIEKQFDGKIDVQSSPEGTTFIVTIEAVQDILET
ncbi:ATP-binding protein, partial [bacterium]|nr:ATP-binding protein [bacterium]